MKEKEAWIIFDADNTLWDIEHLYDQARSELCSYLNGFGYSKDEIDQYQRDRDAELAATYGYSCCRFSRSFEDTAVRFFGDSVDDLKIIHCRSLAQSVFEKSARVNPHVEALFSTIKITHKLGLITAGEKWVQEKRLADFHLVKEIDAIDVVEVKTESVFRNFIEQHKVDKALSWVVGDSMRSDIIPAKKSGLNAILYTNKNWKEYEHVENDGFNPDGTVTDLRNILEKINVK